MTVTELARLGREMRAAQRRYFSRKNRTLAALKESMELEARFDEAVFMILNGSPTLFDRPENSAS